VQGQQEILQSLGQISNSIYTFDANHIALPVQLNPDANVSPTGMGLANVLDRLYVKHPERFEALNEEMARWLPEFDRILFDTPSPGMRSFLLRTREGLYPIPASELSHGTLLALALLTLAHVPNPSPLVCIEEPDRGLHPRLLRNIRDALYRLAYPSNYGESRPPVQVVATTHSPYLLDLFRDHPNEIVIAHKVGSEARFEALSSRSDLQEMLQETPLGEVWYTGILGGVPGEG
jgi:predicted ATPase